MAVRRSRPVRVKLSSLLPSSSSVHRWVEHTAELELEIAASSEAEVFAEALAALAELVDGKNGPPVTREIELEAEDRAMLLVEWLDELVYRSEPAKRVYDMLAIDAISEQELRARIRKG